MSQNVVNHYLLDCAFGYYGYRCEKKSFWKLSEQLDCNYIDGICNEGCQAGYIGKMCNICKKY